MAELMRRPLFSVAPGGAPFEGVQPRSFHAPKASVFHEPALGIAKLILPHSRAREMTQTLRAFNLNDPAAFGRTAQGRLCVAKIAPSERLLIGDEGAIADIVSQAALKRRFIVSLTHGFTALRLKGEAARDLLASLTPLDLDTAAFPVDACAQSLLGERPVFLQRMTGENDFRLIVDQAYRDYVWSMLCDAAENLDPFS